MTIPLLLYALLFALQLITMILLRKAWKRAGKSFRPMMLFLLFTFMMDTLRIFISVDPQAMFRLQDLQSLLTLLLIIWQAKLWGLSVKQYPGFYKFIYSFIVIAWITERIFFHDKTVQGSVFNISSYFIIAIVAMEMLMRNMARSRLLFRNDPVSLFSIGLLFFFITTGVTDLFANFLLKGSPLTLNYAFYFYCVPAIFIQLLFIRSVICIQPKQVLFIS